MYIRLTSTPRQEAWPMPNRKRHARMTYRLSMKNGATPITTISAVAESRMVR